MQTNLCKSRHSDVHNSIEDKPVISIPHILFTKILANLLIMYIPQTGKHSPTLQYRLLNPYGELGAETISVFQASDWNDKHSVLAAVRVLPHTRKHHHEGRLSHPRRVYHTPQLKQTFRAITYRLFPAEFYLDKPVLAVPQVDDRIAFKPGIVPVMIDRAAKTFSEHAQVADAHGLEKQPERLEVIEQVVGTYAEARCSDR